MIEKTTVGQKMDMILSSLEDGDKTTAELANDLKIKLQYLYQGDWRMALQILIYEDRISSKKIAYAERKWGYNKQYRETPKDGFDALVSITETLKRKLETEHAQAKDSERLMNLEMQLQRFERVLKLLEEIKLLKT